MSWRARRSGGLGVGVGVQGGPAWVESAMLAFRLMVAGHSIKSAED
ncbi:hypothetical protein [Nonomuraea antimicrobica]